MRERNAAQDNSLRGPAIPWIRCRQSLMLANYRCNTWCHFIAASMPACKLELYNQPAAARQDAHVRQHLTYLVSARVYCWLYNATDFARCASGKAESPHECSSDVIGLDLLLPSRSLGAPEYKSGTKYHKYLTCDESASTMVIQESRKLSSESNFRLSDLHLTLTMREIASTKALALNCLTIDAYFIQTAPGRST